MQRLLKILEKIVAVATVVTQLLVALVSVKKGDQPLPPPPPEATPPAETTPEPADTVAVPTA